MDGYLDGMHDFGMGEAKGCGYLLLVLWVLGWELYRNFQVLDYITIL